MEEEKRYAHLFPGRVIAEFKGVGDIITSNSERQSAFDTIWIVNEVVDLLEREVTYWEDYALPDSLEKAIAMEVAGVGVVIVQYTSYTYCEEPHPIPCHRTPVPEWRFNGYMFLAKEAYTPAPLSFREPWLWDRAA